MPCFWICFEKWLGHKGIGDQTGVAAAKLPMVFYFYNVDNDISVPNIEEESIPDDSGLYSVHVLVGGPSRLKWRVLVPTNSELCLQGAGTLALLGVSPPADKLRCWRSLHESIITAHSS